MQNEVKLQIGKWGNSLGIRLPKHLLTALHLSSKDSLSCSIENGKLILEPEYHQKKITLEELLSEDNESCEEVSWGKPEGKEIW